MKFYAPKYKQLDLGLLRSSSKMLDGNVLLRQECDEVPKGTLSCPDRNLAVFHHYRRYEDLRLLLSACEQIIIQQALIILKIIHNLFGSRSLFMIICFFCAACSRYHDRSMESYNSWH